MTTRKDFEDNVTKCEELLRRAKAQLLAWDELPENNVFDSIGDALAELEETLCEKAEEDCEGAYNCGNETYTRKFKVKDDPNTYEATVHVEYNRHDKTYYYVESSKISYTVVA